MDDLTEAERAAVAAIVEAITNEGPQPDYHYAMKQRHRRQWPTLWRALDALVAERRKRGT